MKQEPGRQQPGISGLQAGEDVKMLTKRAALSESQQGGLSRRPLSLPALKDGVSRGGN